MAKGPTAADMLPQVPLQSTNGLCTSTCAKLNVTSASGPSYRPMMAALLSGRDAAAEAVNLPPVRIRAAEGRQDDGVAGGVVVRLHRRLGEEYGAARAAAHEHRRDFVLHAANLIQGSA